MIKYIFRRLLYIIFVFFILSILMFGIYKSLPGDPARMMLEGSRETMDPELYDKMYQDMREQLGLDKPIYVQYISWMSNMLRGEFGFSSVYKQKVVEVIKAPMKNTIILNIVSLVFVFIITIPLGIATAVRKGSLFDSVTQVLTIIGYSLPGFIIAILFIFVFAVKIRLFPISGVSSPGVTLEGWAYILDRAYYLVLPVTAMVFSSLAGIVRYVRATMIDTLTMDYIRTARAKGLREKVVIYSHAFRNAMIPFMTILISWFISIFSGSVVIENIFLYPGMGRIMLNSLMQQDFMVVLAMQMFYVVLSLAGYLIMDLAYVLVDPRVKLS
ncbi:MAG: ABC transporter permease [Eubacteriales bacterium]